MGPIELDSGGLLGGALVGLASILGSLRYVRRQLSRDQTELKIDAAERNQIGRLEEAAKEANGLREEVGKKSARIAGLESDIKHLRIENARLMRDIKRAVKGLPDSAREFLETDFSALADVEERIEDGKR